MAESIPLKGYREYPADKPFLETAPWLIATGVLIIALHHSGLAT